MQKRIILSTTILLILPYANAVEINKDFSATIGIKAVSEYRRSGLDVSDGKPAIQTTTSIKHNKSNISLNFQTSNYDVGTEAKSELAYTLGYFKVFGEKAYIYTSIGQTHYPKQSESNMIEYVFNGNYKGFTLDIVKDWSTADKGTNPIYRYVGYIQYFPQDISLWARIGYNDLDTNLYSSDGSTRQTFFARNVELKKKWKKADIDFTLTYVDTDFSENECIYYMGYVEKCEPRFIFGVKKEF
ncbi:TorF family putative porin [Acinetobacter radioresistens]|uniref:TorF family putative porin n=1 Tax=Acinetobacter radioresistens TaxID=40216 RepID=UPI0009466881|nr:TorF family putative porin [Acinetobacter radioresistens]